MTSSFGDRLRSVENNQGAAICLGTLIRLCHLSMMDCSIANILHNVKQDVFYDACIMCNVCITKYMFSSVKCFISVFIYKTCKQAI